MTDIVRVPGASRGRCRFVCHGGLVWTVAIGPGKTVAEQTAAMLHQIDENLRAAGTTKHRIVEAVIYLADMSTKSEMDGVWCDWIPDDGWPCRACVAVDLAGGDLVEIKVTAAL